MGELSFEIVEARAQPHAAVPTLAFRLRVGEDSGEPIYALALRCQVQIEPRQRRYSAREAEGLLDLFGEPSRWGDTLRTVLWTQAALLLPGFQGRTEVELPLVCTYDFEVAAAKYFHALEDGQVPLRLLFSGTVFAQRERRLSIEPVPWEKELTYRLPVAAWRDVMERYFPGSAWLRLRRETFDALHRFRSRRALPTWDDALEALLAAAREREDA